MEHFDSTRSLGFAEETVSASPFAWDHGQHEWQQPWAHHDIPGTPWTHGGGQETDEEPDSDCAAAIWRELSGEVQEEDCVASAAAAAAAALASGEPQPANTAACLRARVPGLLGMKVELPGCGEAGGAWSQPLTPEPREDEAAPLCHTPAAAGDSRDAIRLQLPLACGTGREQGRCVFTLAALASPEERQQLASFTARLGRRLERARQHLAKQELEGSLYELSQAFARGDSLEGRPSAASLPPLPSWCGSPRASWVGSTSSTPKRVSARSSIDHPGSA
ncbi:hypothetical protein ACK3TF_001978 [Chlorella vulgaris]